jgi:anthranilate phosphoribosyltransferase
VLAGEPGAPRDVVLLNAGAALLVSGAASTVGEGIAMGARAIDSGAASRVLERMVALSVESLA